MGEFLRNSLNSLRKTKFGTIKSGKLLVCQHLLLRLINAVVLSLLVISPSFALDPGKTLSQYIHDAWRTEEGLPQMTVQAALQTRDGYLWLGTQSGLARFNGERFTVFDSSNTKNFPGDNIVALSEDLEGNLWVGTTAGLLRYRDGEFTPFADGEGVAKMRVFTLRVSRSGVLWVGTSTGLKMLRDGKLTGYTTQEGLSSNSIASLYEDRSGTLWVGTYGGGLNSFRDEKFTRYGTEEGLPDNTVQAIYEDRSGNLWIGTYNGLAQLRDQKIIPIEKLSGQTVTSLVEDRDSILWVGASKGLYRLENGDFTGYGIREGLSNDSVTAITEDREGSLWVGTYEGLNRLSDSKFTTYTKAEGLVHDIVLSVYEDRQGVLWLGTMGGLTGFKHGKFNAYTKEQGLPNEQVNTTYEDAQGNFWIGTANGLVQFQQGKVLRVYNTEDGLSNKYVSAISQDEAGDLWIGTAGGGLSKLSGGKFSHFTAKDGLPSDYVRVVIKDAADAGGIWVGTASGLSHIVDGKSVNYTTAQGLSGETVMSLYSEKDGSVWIGTVHGLNHLKDGKISVIRAENGLFSNVIYQILDGSDGNLWMSGNKGVFRVSRRELTDFIEGRASSVKSVAYGLSDGMKSPECTGGAGSPGIKTADGKLWFPTPKGVAGLHPQSLRVNPVPPPVYVEEMTADNQPIRLETFSELAPGTAKLEFRYAGLSFVAPERVRFRYQLEGFDHDWVEAGTRRTAYYSNLPPGEYRFRVMAANSDGVWSEQGASLAFTLKPFFYQTRWFYLLCTVLVAFIGWLLYRLRMIQLRREFAAVLAERGRMSRELHDNLSQVFTGISLHLNTAKRIAGQQPEEAWELVERSGDLARKGMEETHRSIWALQPEAADESSNLPNALQRMVSQLLIGSNLQPQIIVEGEARPLPPEVNANLFHIAQEALTNALKHSGADSIRIELTYKPAEVELFIADNGKGFDSENGEKTGGFGLANLRQRSTRIGGQLNIKSQPGRGSEIKITVPI